MPTEYTSSLGENNIKKECCGIYDMEMVWLLLLLSDTSALLLLVFVADVQDCVLNSIVPIIEKCANKICTIVYTYVRYLCVILG